MTVVDFPCARGISLTASLTCCHETNIDNYVIALVYVICVFSISSPPRSRLVLVFVYDGMFTL